jgi:hypothetical protein
MRAPKPSARAATALFLGLSIATGCSGGDGNYYPSGTVLPPDPVLGPDADADGVRDDIAQYIDDLVTLPLDREALRQYARAKRNMLAVPLEREAAVAAMGQSFRALECLFFVRRHVGTNDPGALVEVTARTLDTLKRSKAYLQREKLVGGMHYALAPRAQSSRACDFDTSTIGGVP